MLRLMKFCPWKIQYTVKDKIVSVTVEMSYSVLMTASIIKLCAA